LLLGSAQSGWLGAAKGKGNLCQWADALSDLAGWRVSAMHIALLTPRRLVRSRGPAVAVLTPRC
jgi:hypothetical protein